MIILIVQVPALFSRYATFMFCLNKISFVLVGYFGQATHRSTPGWQATKNGRLGLLSFQGPIQAVSLVNLVHYHAF
jgi:hypothetical protein